MQYLKYAIMQNPKTFTIMKTLQNIKPEHLLKFKELVLQGVKFGSYDDGEPTSLLDWARETFPPYLDEVITNEIQCEIFQNAFEQVKVIALCEVEDKPGTYHLADAEPDIVHFSIRFEDPYVKGLKPTDENMELLFTWVMAIMLSDCTGCCNALSVLNVSQAGIYATGYVGQTYHS